MVSLGGLAELLRAFSVAARELFVHVSQLFLIFLIFDFFVGFDLRFGRSGEKKNARCWLGLGLVLFILITILIRISL